MSARTVAAALALALLCISLAHAQPLKVAVYGPSTGAKAVAQALAGHETLARIIHDL